MSSVALLDYTAKRFFSAVSELLLEAHIEVEDAILQKESIDTVWQILESTIKLAINKFDPKSVPKKRNAKNECGSITQPDEQSDTNESFMIDIKNLDLVKIRPNTN